MNDEAIRSRAKTLDIPIPSTIPSASRPLKKGETLFHKLVLHAFLLSAL